MNFERRLKKHIDQKLEKEVPNPYKKKRFPLWAKIMIPITAVTIAVAVPILVFNSNKLDNIINLLQGTYVDMEGVKGFGIGNVPSNDTAKAKLKSMRYLNNPSTEVLDTSEEKESSDNDYSSVTSWTDEERERYEWESDYDWDPDKANVLFSLDDDGKVTEVIYEMTNNKGVVRQSRLGNAAAMFVSKSFTYVMYVNDSEWEFWKEIDYAQELRQPTGFHVHHDEMQTIVIHNETGKVFALKDLQTKVSEVTGAKNYTMQANPTRDDFVYVDPMYGTFAQMTPLCFKVVYDKELDIINYVNVLPVGCGYRRAHSAKEDKYHQLYVLADDEGYDQTIRLKEDKEMIPFPNHKIIENTLIMKRTNAIYFGNDDRAYTVEDNKLKVFGEDFSLSPVEQDISVNFEGLANEFFSALNDTGWLNGSCFHYEEGYLYSAFGEVWKVDIDGELTKLDNLEGNFVKYTNDALMIGGEIIAFVNTKEYLHYSVDGVLVQLKFHLKDGIPSYEAKHIINMTEYHNYGHRLIALQDEEGGYGFPRGFTKYYLITVKDGEAFAQYVAYGDNGGMIGVAGTISEPIDLTV